MFNSIRVLQSCLRVGVSSRVLDFVLVFDSNSRYLADSRADAELDDFGENLRVLDAVAEARHELTGTKRDHSSGSHHIDIRPKHEIVRLWRRATCCGGGLERGGGGRMKRKANIEASRIALPAPHLKLFLEAADDAVAGEAQQDERQAERRTRTASFLLLGHRHHACTTDDGKDLPIFAERVTRAAENDGANHDRDHLAGFGEGNHGERYAVRQSQRGEGLGADLGCRGVVEWWWI